MFRTKRSGLVRRLWRSRAAAAAPTPLPGAEGSDAAAAGQEAADCGGPGSGGPGTVGGCCLGKAAAKMVAKSGNNAALNSEQAELKALTHSVLKRIKEKQLEALLQAVESKGGARSPCLLLPGKVDAKVGQQSYSLPLLLSKVFRWPDLRHTAELKRLSCCESYGKGANNPELVCCNPHHMSRLCQLESPPPPYSRYPPTMDFLKPPDSPDSGPASSDTGGTTYSAPVGLSDSVSHQGDGGDPAYWCVVAYWEEKTRVGRLYSVREPSLDIFYDLPQGSGFCLGQLCSPNNSSSSPSSSGGGVPPRGSGGGPRSPLVSMVRAKIGHGVTLSREADGVWAYNRSQYPIFIKSATLDNPDSRALLVHKVFPGFSVKAFDFEKARALRRPNDHEFTQQPRTGFTVQISFVKGWGQCYTRQFISSCPCWLEVIFNTR